MNKELKIRCYGRYVDDMVFVHRDKEYLKSVIPEIRNYLSGHLKLELHEKKIYLQHCRKGVKFLGAILKPYRIYIDNRTKGNFYAKIGESNKMLQVGKNKIGKKQAASIIAGVNSYLGLLGHYRTAKLRRKMMSKFSVYFWNYAYIKKSRKKTAGKGFMYLAQRIWL